MTSSAISTTTFSFRATAFPSDPAQRQHCTQRLALRQCYPAELACSRRRSACPTAKIPRRGRRCCAVSRPRANRKRKAGTIPMWDEDPEKLQLTYERCRLDVITARAVWQSPKLKQLSETERRYQLQDLAINRPRHPARPRLCNRGEGSRHP